MPKKSGLINERERAICARVRQLRRQIKWPQRAFAEAVGISRDQLANIEYSRVPLRYGIGANICQAFDVSVEWLITQSGEMFGGAPFAWAAESGPKTYGKLFSEVYDLSPELFAPADPQPSLVLEATSGFDAQAFLLCKVVSWFQHHKFRSAVEAENFARGVCDFAVTLLKVWRESGRSWRPALVKHAHILAAEKPLTETSKVSRTDADMRSALERLIEDARKLTKQRGMKAKLAKALKMPHAQARLSGWLAGTYAPAGEAALRLRELIDHPERWSK